MSFSINDIKQELRFQGARPNLFDVTITMKGDNATAASQKTQFMCEAAQLPSYNIGVASVFYFGRRLPLSGDRTFDPWTVTVINDEDFLIRNTLESWSNQINLLEGNRKALTDYKSTAVVRQYGKTGNVLRVYNFVGLWPAVINPIELGWDQNDTVERFAVQFEYDYFTVSGSTGVITGT